MTEIRITVRNVSAVDVPDELPPAITRSRQLVEAVLAQSLRETGTDGRTALAWQWALTGTRPSPVTLGTPPGRPPSRAEIRTEADAPPEGSTAPLGVPTDFCDQLREVRRVLAWLAGDTDEIPVDDDSRSLLVGARDGYLRSNDEIRQARDWALLGLQRDDLPCPMDTRDARRPWAWPAEWMDAAWSRGIRDLLNWVLGDRAASPLCGRIVGLPAGHDLMYEDDAAADVALQGRPAGLMVNPDIYPPPQYGEAIQEAIRWLRGESTTPPVDQHGCGAYLAIPGSIPD
jgi:hypothetical protein